MVQRAASAFRTHGPGASLTPTSNDGNITPIGQAILQFLQDSSEAPKISISSTINSAQRIADSIGTLGTVGKGSMHSYVLQETKALENLGFITRTPIKMTSRNGHKGDNFSITEAGSATLAKLKTAQLQTGQNGPKTAEGGP